MTFALFMRRWAILASGALLLVLGAVVLYTHLPIALGWVEYAPVSGMAFYPGLTSAPGTLDGIGRLSFDGYASFGGQVSIALGTALVTGWVGFTLGRRS